MMCPFAVSQRPSLRWQWRGDAENSPVEAILCAPAQHVSTCIKHSQHIPFECSSLGLLFSHHFGWTSSIRPCGFGFQAEFAALAKHIPCLGYPMAQSSPDLELQSLQCQRARGWLFSWPRRSSKVIQKCGCFWRRHFLGTSPCPSKYRTIVFDQLSYLPSQGGAGLMESA